MKKELERVIERFKKSQTSLEAYQAISDFVKIIITASDFIEQVEKEGEDIFNAQIELNADKGDYSKEHNERRDKKGKALFQLDPLFPLRNLHNVHLGIQNKNIIDNSNWLFHRFGPDDPLPEADRKEYQGFIDKLYKRILPFLKNETNEQYTEEIKVKSYDEEKKILTIGNYKVQIAKHEGNNNAHEIMAYIFIDKRNDLNTKFYYADIADERFRADYDSKSKYAHQPYSGACKRINQIIKDETNGNAKDFLNYSYSTLGSVQVNHNYLEIKQELT